MRRLVLLGLIAIMAISAGAAKPDAITKVTVAQLEQALAAAVHKSDAAMTREIRGMQLTEQLTDATLERLTTNLKAGSKAARALHLLADQSAFLDPPAGEIPSTPAPDDATQRQMFAAARNYVSQTVLHLPNFLATRTDNRFDNSQRSPDNDVTLSRVGNSSREVSIRNDRGDPNGDQMTSWGEFGAMLGMVLNDASHGWVTWSRWEQTPAGPAAVFRYFVPKAASHLAVYIPVLEQPALKDRELSPDLMSGFGDPQASLRTNHPHSSNNSVILAKPGYRGLIWLDPATGTVLRITMEANPGDIAPYQRAAMMVEYGPVRIGDSSFVCPIRSLSILEFSPKTKTSYIPDEKCMVIGLGGGPRGTPDCENEGGGTKAPPTLWLNETLFTGYHRFAATTRILSDEASSKGEPAHDEGSQPSKPAKESAVSAPQAVVPVPAPQPGDHSNAAAPATEQQPLSEPAASTQKAAAAATAPQPGTPPEMPSSVQTTASVATSFSVQPIAPKNTGPIVATNAPQNTVPTIQVNVNRVLVPVVVRDRQGRVVGDLKQQDFEVFDNNKPRAISAFTIEKRGSAEVSAVSGAAGGAGPPAAPSAMPPQPAPPRFIVFLFDDRHLTLQDLAYAQKAAVKGLDGALAGPSDRAIVLSTTGSVNSSLTADRTKLQEAIMAVKPQGISRPTTTGCPKIDYYQADQIVNKNDDAAFMDAVRQYLGCQPGTPSPCGISMQEQSGISTPQDLQVRCLKMSQPGVDVMTISTNFLLQILHPVLDTYAFIGGVVSKLAALPGERTLILISSGFPNNDPQAQAMESRLIDFAAQSNVTIDALDARGMYTTVLSAGEELAGANLVLRDQFRSAAESQDDAPMANLADGTGGTFFHHDNDLDAGFKKLTEAPEIVYLLELSLDGVKADGTFHRLKVKVRRDDVDVKARSEFFMPRPAKGK